MKKDKTYSSHNYYFISSTLLISAESKDNKTTTLKTSADTKPISIKQFDTPPEQIRQFRPKWEVMVLRAKEGVATNTDYNYLGDPKAVKGGCDLLVITGLSLLH
ncbi:MAG: hypothetical protein IPG09_15210 [Ignavibacteria bacterium]|nr:hypothetical protein [Ignavibacteria bacterium]